MFPPIFQTLKADAAVTAIVPAANIYRHGSVPQEGLRRYVVWQIVGDDPENQLSGTPGADKYIVQVDCYHDKQDEVVDLAKATRNALEPVCHLTGVPIDERETDTKLYRIALQFDFIHLRDA